LNWFLSLCANFWVLGCWVSLRCLHLTSAIAEVAAHKKSDRGFVNRPNESVVAIWVGRLLGGDLQWLVIRRQPP
jgi:hypothetical protein